MFNRSVILEQRKKYDSFYLYDESKIIEYTSLLKSNFDNVEFLYSNKTNPNPLVLKTIFSQGFGSDSASLKEVLMAHVNGVKKEDIHYSAPGKSRKDIESALELSVIIADSLNELYLIQEIAKEKGIIARIGIRINPDFGFYFDEGKASKFGIDEKVIVDEKELIQSFSNLEIIGLHVHIRSQELKAEVIEKYYNNIIDLAYRLETSLENKLEFINLGSGLGINYTEHDDPLDIKSLGEATNEIVNKAKAKMPDVTFLIETGRYVVTKSGVYVTKVLDKKKSYNKNFIILNNTLNGFLRPALEKLIMKYSSKEHLRASEPLFTGRNTFEFVVLNDETGLERVTLAGNLCTETDTIAEDILLPKLHIGDSVLISNAGSYAAVLSPMQFSSQIPPVELFLAIDGSVSNTSENV